MCIEGSNAVFAIPWELLKTLHVQSFICISSPIVQALSRDPGGVSSIQCRFHPK